MWSNDTYINQIFCRKGFSYGWLGRVLLEFSGFCCAFVKRSFLLLLLPFFWSRIVNVMCCVFVPSARRCLLCGEMSCRRKSFVEFNETTRWESSGDTWQMTLNGQNCCYMPLTFSSFFSYLDDIKLWNVFFIITMFWKTGSEGKRMLLL